MADFGLIGIVAMKTHPTLADVAYAGHEGQVGNTSCPTGAHPAFELGD